MGGISLGLEVVGDVIVGVGEIVVCSDDVGVTSVVLEAVGDVVGKLVGDSLTGLKVGLSLGASVV